VLDGKQVDELRRLRYSTYAEKLEGAGATPQQPPYLRLSISSTGSGTKDTTLNFEPANNSAQAPVANGEWQTWDAFDGRFRVVEGPGETAGDSPASFITLAAYMARHPQATFAPNPKDFGGEGALAFVVGSSGDNQRNAKFAIDNVSIGTSETIEGTPGIAIKTYDLEGKYTVPTVQPAKRVGAGPVPLTGTAGAGDKVEIRTPGSDGDYSRLAGTATADENGKWTFQLPRITERTMVRAWLADTYGTTEIHSTAAQVDVAFLVTLALETKDGYTIGRTTVDPVVAGVPIVWERYLDKKWTKVLESKTNARGGAVFKWNTVQGTGYVLRARAAGTDTVLEGLSKTQTIRSS
jgi:hypothetical protein